MIICTNTTINQKKSQNVPGVACNRAAEDIFVCLAANRRFLSLGVEEKIGLKKTF